jgi:hypothetical protein
VVSRRVHGCYERRLADTASGSQEVLIHLHARQGVKIRVPLTCSNDACAKSTFAEQAPGLTTRYGRRTCGLDGVLQWTTPRLTTDSGGQVGLSCPTFSGQGIYG